MEYDTYTKRDRLGYGITLKKIALSFVWAGICSMILIGVMTMFTNYATAQVQARDVVATIRYNNIKH